MNKTDLEYLERRTHEEAEAVAAATSTAAASAHRVLAEHYAARAAAMRSTGQQLPRLATGMPT